MKKLLIATTALAFSAGMASAEVALSGSGEFGLKYDSGNLTDSITAGYDVELNIKMSGKTDTGLSFGAAFDLGGIGDTTAKDATGGSKVWVSGGWGKISVGESADDGDGASGIGIADVGYSGLGVDNVAEGLFSKGPDNIGYRGTFGAISVGVSYLLPVSDGAANGDWSVGVGYKGDGYKVGLAFDSMDVLSIGGGVTMGAISVNAMFSDAPAGQAYGVDFGYKLNSATTITAAYADSDAAGQAVYGVGVKYSLGGGASLAAGIAVATDGDTLADVGMKFDF